MSCPLARAFLPSLFALLLVSCAGRSPAATAGGTLPPVDTSTLAPADVSYLRGIMRETFHSIWYYRHPVTGFPCMRPDSPDPGERCQCDHIGLVLASIAVAGRTGLISDTDARAAISRTLDWCDRIPTARGFPTEHVRSADASQSEFDFGSIGDVGFYPCGLIVVGEAYPEFKSRTDSLVNAIEWDAMLNPASGFYYGVYHVRDGRFSADGIGHVYSCDQRMAYFLGVASGRIPAGTWQRLPRFYLTRYGIQYLKPGEALGGGEQPWSLGYFLDERGSEIGLSNANLAWAQMHYALDMGYPTWGWSSCLTTTGYMGFGSPGTNWSILSPHAVGAAAVYYPHQVARAFRVLEKLGTRQPIAAGGERRAFGFRGSYDIDRAMSPAAVIPGLDQAIIFLSLANCLDSGIVWDLFRRNALVQQGISRIPEYAHPKPEQLALFRERDAAGAAVTGYRPAAQPLMLDEPSRGDAARFAALGCDVAVDTHRRVVRRVNFGSANCGSLLSVKVGGIDARPFRALRFRARTDTPGQLMLQLRMGGEGGYRILNVGTDWADCVIPFRSFLGGLEDFDFSSLDPVLKWTACWHDRSRLDEIVFQSKSLCGIELADLSLVPLTQEEAAAVAAALARPAAAVIGVGGLLDRLDGSGGWSTQCSNGSSATLGTSSGRSGPVLSCEYALARGGWLCIVRPMGLALPDSYSISIALKAEGGPADLEVKLIDRTGATYLARRSGAVRDGPWREVIIPSSEFVYGWGGEQHARPDEIVEFQFAVTSSGGARGRVFLSELMLGR